ncbi:Cu(I)-responsive transcriptional regulator [Castellaniella caeni]|uniref:Cu(I)-responsive transcriptional regulator n=1 Tax=Castellaniella caeni TaxID=266123 RepID=UPI00082C96BF|nr:Cu(I)-responsive transcriptional regulator [Castellaniella caeni]
MHTIGEAATLTGLTPKMIRYYESQALFAPHGRSAAGYRLYDEADLHALRFIRSARDLGFSLAQVAALTDLWRDRHRASAEVKRLALDHIEALEHKAAVLHSMAATLRALAEHCHGDERPDCPILEGLAANATAPSQPADHSRSSVR